MTMMRVDFYKAKGGQLCGWVAALPKRRPFQGTTMAAGRSVPHDLMQFVVERALGIPDGFWGLLSHDAWFKSVPGRRPTRSGRALARAYCVSLVAVEERVNRHYLAWRRGEATPMRRVLDETYARWVELADGEQLVLEWPIQPLANVRRPQGRAPKPRLRPHHASGRA